jgi:hypothetical protein
MGKAKYGRDAGNYQVEAENLDGVKQTSYF